MLSLEAHILFSNNKTKEWLESKSPEELESLMETACKSVPKHKQKFKEQLSAIQAHRTELQQKQELEKQATKQRLLLQKAWITTDMIEYGLWQTQADINNGLKLCKSETQKRQAIKSQLRFRKTVLEQTYDANKDIYKFSTKYKGQLNSIALKDNLLKLINAASNKCSSGCTGSDSPLISDINLVGKRINHQFIVAWCFCPRQCTWLLFFHPFLLPLAVLLGYVSSLVGSALGCGSSSIP